MTDRSALQRINRWTEDHPWLTLGLVALFGLVLVLLIPPRDSLPFAALKVAVWLALYLGFNLLRYRSPFPTRDRIEAEEAKADEIDASVRRARDRDAGL